MNRPYPSKELGEFKDGYQIMIEPAYDLPLFVKKTLLNPDDGVFNNDHYHLDDAIDSSIAFLWSASGFEKQMKHVIGQTEQLMFRAGGFQRMRQEQQFNEWFGYIPEFVITLNGAFCREASDNDFMALLDHELMHIGHVTGEFGAPKFSRDTGLPVLGMRDHDVSEFVGVVERYGVPKDSALERMVAAANSKPLIASVDIKSACATCLKKAA
ncbi:MAG: putative metallopeptidase [Methylophilus sp.]|jgi:hypothetical protein